MLDKFCHSKCYCPSLAKLRNLLCFVFQILSTFVKSSYALNTYQSTNNSSLSNIEGDWITMFLENRWAWISNTKLKIFCLRGKNADNRKWLNQRKFFFTLIASSTVIMRWAEVHRNINMSFKQYVIRQNWKEMLLQTSWHRFRTRISQIQNVDNRERSRLLYLSSWILQIIKKESVII